MRTYSLLKLSDGGKKKKKIWLQCDIHYVILKQDWLTSIWIFTATLFTASVWLLHLKKILNGSWDYQKVLY